MSAPVALPLPLPRRSVADDAWEVARPYVGLTRPRILALVVVTALPALLAPGPPPRAGEVLLLLLATVLLGASCDAWNAWIERRTDALMARTRNRPLPRHRLPPGHAVAFATACGAVSLGTFAALDARAALVAALVLIHYVVVYSLWLKRRTPWNIVIGGIAGGAAPVLADLALRGQVGATAWLLLAIITAWTPPHFWAIALVRKEEYAAAAIPMLPVVAGDRATRAAMLRWTVVLLAVSTLPVALGVAGPIYAVGAALLGAGFTLAVLRCVRAATRAADREVFLASVRYMALLVAAWAGDVAASRLLDGLA